MLKNIFASETLADRLTIVWGRRRTGTSSGFSHGYAARTVSGLVQSFLAE